jgi:hypothetical protein
MAALSGRVHILLHECPLTARGSLRLLICRGSSSGGSGRRNYGRRDVSNYREGQRVAMNNGMERRPISRSWGGDGLLYCRGDGCGCHSHRGSRDGLL